MKTQFILLFLLSSFTIFAQDCSISDLVAEPYGCENDSFYVDIDFNYDNVGDNGFMVVGNGNNYGTYSYDSLFITLGPLPANGTEYEFVIIDVDNENCTEAVELGIVECEADPCELNELTVVFDECTSDSTYRITINFNYQNVIGDFFDLFANGEFFGFYAYEDLPLTIDHFPQSGNNFDWVKVCDNDNEDCCAVKEYESPNCGNNAECNIWDISYEVVACENDSFYLIVNFHYDNVGDLGFEARGNGQSYGIFEYGELPITIGPLPANETEYELVIIDQAIEGCAEDIGIGQVECESDNCEIWDLTATILQCTSDSTYAVKINFNHSNTSDTGFFLYANGVYFNNYHYSDLPLIIVDYPKSGGNNDWIKVCDNLHDNCCAVIEYESPNCGNQDACHIWDLEYAVICMGDSFSITIDFNYDNVGDDGFKVAGNGNNYGIYGYQDLPVTIGPLPIHDIQYELVVFDVQNNDCATAVEIGELDCEAGDCEIWGLEVEVLECTSDSTYNLWVDFNSSHDGEIGFDVWANGSYYGFFSYEELPLTLEHFPMSECGFDWIKICDNDNENCCTTLGWESPECEGNEMCSIWDASYEIDCVDEDFWITINFNFDNVGNDGFEVRGNGVSYGNFEYANVPVTIGPLQANETQYEFIIIDNEHEDCGAVLEVGQVDCSGGACELWDLVTDIQECTSDSTYNMFINFNYQGVTGVGFDVFINGLHFGFYSYDDLPVLLENVPDRETDFQHIRICENDNDDCCVVKEFEGPDCGTSGINDNDNPGFTLYPNPVANELYSTHPLNDVSMVDAMGRMVMVKPLDNKTWDVSHLSSGYYILIVDDGKYQFGFVKL